MLRSILIASTVILVVVAPASGADSTSTTAPSAQPSSFASLAIPTADELPADGFDVFAESPGMTASLGLYSGLSDPSWELSDEEAAALSALLETLSLVDGSAPSGGLGYHGFRVEQLTREGTSRMLVAFEGTVSDPASSHLSYLDDPERSVEHFLLDSGRHLLSAAEVMALGLDPEPTRGHSARR